MSREKSSVFKMLDAGTLPLRHYKAWEYLLPGDEVEVKMPGAGLQLGLVLDVMPDGSGVWLYVNDVGKRLFGVDEDVEIAVIKGVERPDITSPPTNSGI